MALSERKSHHQLINEIIWRGMASSGISVNGGVSSESNQRSIAPLRCGINHNNINIRQQQRWQRAVISMTWRRQRLKTTLDGSNIK